MNTDVIRISQSQQQYYSQTAPASCVQQMSDHSLMVVYFVLKHECFTANEQLITRTRAQQLVPNATGTTNIQE